ncbi:DUF4347 domain-containing protein, partial [Fastidiosibacter lacustris]|uniref:DUF4347 domain-containing protein n=1 Tax=Fastidiosibacter lacustris TaxID=2056695 RepID=UPI000E3546FB
MIKQLYKVVQSQLHTLVSANKTNKNKKDNRMFYQPQPSLLQELEPRIMFDGAAIATVDIMDGVNADEQNYVLAALAENEHANQTESLLQAIMANSEAFTTDYSRFKEVIIIDSQVKDPHVLIGNITRDAAVEVILPGEDGVDEIAKILQKYSNLSAVHIVSHGDVGKLYLGNEALSLDNIGDYAASLAQWGKAL